MSTRSAIARPFQGGWEGRYHHSDGYPTGVGARLFELYHGHFATDLGAMERVLLEDHTGWSNIWGDFDHTPGYGGDGPACYCHGDRSEGIDDPFIRCTCPHADSTCDGLFIEWAYILSPRGIAVQVSRRTSGVDINMDYQDNPYESPHYEHVPVGFINWDDSPDFFQVLETKGQAIRSDAHEPTSA